MRYVVLALVAMAASGAQARDAADYPSCRLAEQHGLTGHVGGAIRDPRQAHVAMRANVLQADIGTARKARRITAAGSDRAWRQVDAIRHASDRLTRRQGFLSAAERADFDRRLDAIARPICG